ncbi:MAG: hypothetical protein KGL63_01705 [Betaproteobacteria bacterium]|nr:hypothetical protein [Betaproteobacteria bacterium]
MTDQVWTWWVGHDDERFHTECATRDEAVQIARTEGGGYIVEATQCKDVRLSGYFDADYFLDTANETACDIGDPDGDPMFDLLSEQEADLQIMVRAAIDAWQDKHGLKFRAFRFDGQRNLEFIPDEEENP